MTRRVAIAALVAPALVLVALAARSYRPFGGEPSGERQASTVFLDSVLTVTLVLAAVVALIGLWARLRVRRGGEDHGTSPYAGIVALVVITLAATVIGRALLDYKPRPQGSGAADPAFLPQPRPGQPPPQEEDSDRTVRVIWPLAIGLATLIAAVVVLFVVVERRRLRSGALSEEELEKLAQALDEAIEDLRREPDPRRAVVAAYARMEQALSYHGLPRRSSETPYEYLGRVGRELDAEDQVAGLTALFEEAKFSEHAVDERMRGRAIDALVAVRSEVRAAT